MTKQINTYKELVDEKKRLEDLLKVQKATIREDLRQLGEEFRPVKSALTAAGKLFTRDNHNLLLNAGANTLIDLIIKKLILSKSGWITRLIVPFLMKNYSSHIISEKKDTLLRKLFAWVSKKNANGHESVHEETGEEDEAD